MIVQAFLHKALASIFLPIFVLTSALQVVMRLCRLFYFFAGAAVCARPVAHKRLAAIAAAQVDLLTLFIFNSCERDKKRHYRVVMLAHRIRISHKIWRANFRKFRFRH
ncbi:MAG TPA: hypothetical protein DD666_13440 [Advenella kashmirensis]|uniref:Uncharacterized protein n=1 Tax=Advenella kashmirensis TaxID=310575 RepID=A0A356LIL4_9BURK|nr:hypothetical protein [Advenella kashmirensis]